MWAEEPTVFDLVAFCTLQRVHIIIIITIIIIIIVINKTVKMVTSAKTVANWHGNHTVERID